MLLTELKEHTFEKELEGAIEIEWGDFDYSKEFDCNVLKSTRKPLDGKYYLTNIEEIYHYKNGILHRDNNLPARLFKRGYVFYYVNGKAHRIDGPADIYPNGDYFWHINGYHVDNEKIDEWLEENNIPLDWNIWSDNDKFLFALHWSDYKGII